MPCRKINCTSKDQEVQSVLIETCSKSQAVKSSSGTSPMLTFGSNPPSCFKMKYSHLGLAETLSNGLRQHCITDSEK